MNLFIQDGSIPSSDGEGWFAAGVVRVVVSGGARAVRADFVGLRRRLAPAPTCTGYVPLTINTGT